MISGVYTSKGCQILNEEWLSTSRFKKRHGRKKRRKIRRGKGDQKDGKNEEKGGKWFRAGAF